MSEYQCTICKKQLDGFEAYEYRGLISCAEHFDEMQAKRDFQRNEVMQEEDAKTRVFKGLDISESDIGKANRQLLKGRIEVASKESQRLHNYERGGK